MRKIFTFIGLAVLFSLSFVSCKKEEDIHHKIIDGLPINSDETVLPGRAVQEFYLLARDSMAIIVPVLNRLGTYNAGFSELTPVGSGYSFDIAEKHYKNAHVVFEFRDPSDAVIDPIHNLISTATVSYIAITNFTGSSSLFSFTQTDGRVSLAGPGLTGSQKTYTGTFTFDGQGYHIVFDLTNPGLLPDFQGVFGGRLTAAGNGPTGLPFASALNYSSDLNIDGSIQWESQSGGIHFASNGTGFVATDKERFLLE